MTFYNSPTRTPEEMRQTDLERARELSRVEVERIQEELGTELEFLGAPTWEPKVGERVTGAERWSGDTRTGKYLRPCDGLGTATHPPCSLIAADEGWWHVDRDSIRPAPAEPTVTDLIEHNAKLTRERDAANAAASEMADHLNGANETCEELEELNNELNSELFKLRRELAEVNGMLGERGGDVLLLAGQLDRARDLAAKAVELIEVYLAPADAARLLRGDL